MSEQRESTNADDFGSQTPVKAVELPDCDVAAKHFVSQTFWAQEKLNIQNQPAASSSQQEQDEGQIVRGLGKSEVFVPQQFKNHAQF